MKEIETTLQEYVKDYPLEMLRGANVLLEGLSKSSDEGTHKYSHEAFTILEFLIADCTAVLSNQKDEGK